MYLIDSDIIIYALKKNPLVISHFAATAQAPKALSVVTYGELLYGAMKSARQQENLAKVRRISEIFPVIDVTKAIMDVFSSLKSDLERKGARLDDFDLVIAATALTLNYRLVTNNERYFTRVPGLKIDNWTKLRTASS